MSTLRLLVAAIFISIAHAADRPPNVLFIMADDLGFSDIGCYGGEIETPNLDRLASGGLRFTQFYNTARCWPSRSVLLSGYYAQQIRRDAVPGIQSGGRGVRPKWSRLLPELLKEKGYRSYHSGKWHVDGKPLESGFDRSFLVENHNDFFSTKGASEEGEPVPQTPGYYVTTATADHAIKCLREHSEKYPDRPFFEYLAFIAPHFPLQAPPEDIAKYRDRFRDGWNVAQQARYKRLIEAGIVSHTLPEMEREVGPPYHFPDALPKLGPGEINRPLPWNELTSEQREFQAMKMAIHAAMIDRMDREIGRVLEQLERMGAMENTLIFFASDNGGSAELMVRGNGHDQSAAPGSSNTFLCLGPGWSSVSNTPFRRHKTWVHEGGISSPLVVHWPRGIAAKGELRKTPSHLIDITPTILELAGVKYPAEQNGEPVPPLPGESLLPVFANDGPLQRGELWWAHEGNRAIRVGDLKLVSTGGNEGPWELYDLSKDRGETNNLAAAQPGKVKELAERWTARWNEFCAMASKDAPPAGPAKPGKRKRQVL